MEDDYDGKRDSLESYNVAIETLCNMRGTSRKIVLPELPPPLSACFTNVAGRGRVISKRYKDWTTKAHWEVKQQRVAPMKGEVSISIGLVAKDKRQTDADNYLKSLMDLLTKAGVIEDDSNKYVRRLTVEWLPSGAPVTILVNEYQGAGA